MTNEDVLTLKAAGFGDDFIITKIKASPSGFNLDTPDLVKLKQAGFLARPIRPGVRRTASSRGLPGYLLFNRSAGYSLLEIGPANAPGIAMTRSPLESSRGNCIPERLQRCASRFAMQHGSMLYTPKPAKVSDPRFR